MPDSKIPKAPSRNSPDTHLRNADKLARIPIKVQAAPKLAKPNWIRSKIPTGTRVQEIKHILRENQLHTVCEEAACPNLGECFNRGTATFMIMGDICTRRCPFCDVAHGKPAALDPNEPERLAKTIKAMQLNYVVITSVDRDDLRDGGGSHFADCIKAIRQFSPATQIEILVPDFRGRQSRALEALNDSPPDIFNHNLETILRLYKEARPGASYQASLDLLAMFKQRFPAIPTKSGIMLGLGETLDEVAELMKDLRGVSCNMLTLGQYLQPSADHLAVREYITPQAFQELAEKAKTFGFTQVASNPMVRSSYHADELANQRQA